MTLTPEQLKESRTIMATMGGIARAKKLSKKRRVEIAKMGARARIEKSKKLLTS